MGSAANAEEKRNTQEINKEKGNNLKIMAIHIMLVTLFSLLFLIVGMSVRLDVI